MNNVHITITYLSNFNFKTNLDKTSAILKQKNKNNKVVCKNLIIMFLFLKYFSKVTNASSFVFPKKSSNLTILRSPYRHKLTRHQLTFSRFFIVLNLKIVLKNRLNAHNTFVIQHTIDKIQTYLSFFETNICNQHRLKLMFFFNAPKLLNLNSYITI